MELLIYCAIAIIFGIPYLFGMFMLYVLTIPGDKVPISYSVKRFFAVVFWPVTLVLSLVFAPKFEEE